MTKRTTYLDQDNRREPTGDRFCVACYRPIKGRARVVALVDDSQPFVVHPADVTDERAWLIGPDCAKRLGLEWSRP